MLHHFLPLPVVQALEPEARRLGVSQVARSARGFLPAYKRARGDLTQLPDAWIVRREAFIKRHLGALHHGRGVLFAGGVPTRLHLALVMWAYSPEPARLRAYIAR